MNESKQAATPEWQAITAEIAAMLDARDAPTEHALFALLAMAVAIAWQANVPLERLELEIRGQYDALRRGTTS